MAYGRIKTEHTGAKNGGGAWMRRVDAKQYSRKRRRAIDLEQTIRDNGDGTMSVIWSKRGFKRGNR
jgi:hypothetical protein